MSNAVFSHTAVGGVIQPTCVNLSGVTGPNGSSTGLSLQSMVFRNDAEGNPAPPSLELRHPNFWRFRWALRIGTQTLRIQVKQVSNTNPRPSMVIKANPAVGLLADVSGSAPSGVDWVTIGPLVVTATAAGAVWVELHNNKVDAYDSAFFKNDDAT